MGFYWTIQTEKAWEEAKVRGYLSGDGRRIIPELRPAYHWMMEQMKKRLPLYKGAFPVWLWLKRPDLRQRGHLTRGQKGVLLKAQIPDERVLLSDFDLWHIVLNQFYEKQGESLDFTSWDAIFDMRNIQEEKVQQGTVEKIWLSEIIEIKPFIAR